MWRKVAPELQGRLGTIVPTCRSLAATSLDGEPTCRCRPRDPLGFIDDLEIEGATLVANDTGGAIPSVHRQHPKMTGSVKSGDACDRTSPAVAYLVATARAPGGLWLLSRAVQYKPIQRLPTAYGWATHTAIEPHIMKSYTTNIRANPGVRKDLARVLKQARKDDMQAASQSVANFEKPALVAWSADEKFFPVEHGRRLAELLPNARFELIENSSTFSPEDHPSGWSSS